MYMPTTLPGIGIGKAQELLQQTDRLIASFPEVERVFGKMGRAETATDPAPLSMVETVIRLKPRAQWREGMTLERLVEELDRTVRFPGVTNAWVMPIKTRIDMLATGIKTPVGVKVSGPDIQEIERIGRDLEQALLVMLSLPFALVGGFWFVYLLGYHLSVAVAVGFIALAGVAAEFGVVMLVYLDNALAAARDEGRLLGVADLKAAIMEGAVMRVRPKAMTVATIFAGLLPIMIGHGTGSEVMQRIAAPMVGGMITAPILSLFVIPAIYLVWKRREAISEDRSLSS